MSTPLTPESYIASSSGNEDAHQTALFMWIALNAQQYPKLTLAFAIPNGGQRHKATAAKLKATGVKKGVPDLLLPVARHGLHGLFIELKRPASQGKRKGATADEQDAWIAKLRGERYGACTCYGWEQARDVLLQWIYTCEENNQQAAENVVEFACRHESVRIEKRY